MIKNARAHTCEYEDGVKNFGELVNINWAFNRKGSRALCYAKKAEIGQLMWRRRRQDKLALDKKNSRTYALNAREETHAR